MESKFGSFDIGLPSVDLPSIGSLSDIGNMLNMSDLIAPNARKWLENRDFRVGREMKAAGYQKEHAVVLMPGVISSVGRQHLPR